MLKNFMQTNSNANNTSKTVRNSTTNAFIEKPIDPPKPAGHPAEDVISQPQSREEGNKLTVGPNIKLKGSEITDCEILVVEGRVEASMKSRDIRIAESGVFSGKAEIEVAEIRGYFEGELIANKQLIIYATGKVSGHIRYGAIRIEEGGTISGDIAILSSQTRPLRDAVEMSTVRPFSDTKPDEEIDALQKANSPSSLLQNPAHRRHG